MVLFKLVRKLIDERGYSEVLIHAMGVCISKALHLTQDLLLHYGEGLTFEAHYGTVEVLDDARRDFFTSLPFDIHLQSRL